MAKKKASESVPVPSVKKQKKEVDSVKTFADKIRDHKELESRWAVLQDTRVEYFRGKDFATLLENHAELKGLLGSDLVSRESEDEIGNLLLKRKLVIRCDRVVKAPRPGKKKLSKWPARLELFPEQTFSVDDAFFAWTFEKRRPMWQTVLSFLVPIVTLACCLFPVFPHWCKLIVLYVCLTFLSAIFSILFLRLAIFGFLWILLGKRTWFFPNILAEEATLTELFWFWPEPKKEDEKPPKWTARLAFALGTGLIVWFCVHHAPDEAARARYQKKVSNIIDEVLEWSPKLALSGKQEEGLSMHNETQRNETTGDGVSQNAETISAVGDPDNAAGVEGADEGVESGSTKGDVSDVVNSSFSEQ